MWTTSRSGLSLISILLFVIIVIILLVCIWNWHCSCDITQHPVDRGYSALGARMWMGVLAFLVILWVLVFAASSFCCSSSAWN